MMRFKDKVAIVTGGGQGIGKAIAKAFAAEEAAVVVAARTLPNLEKTVNEITATGGTALARATDITEERQIEGLVADVVKAYGRIDILVNNSGIAGPTAMVPDLDVNEWNQVLAVDLTGSMLCSKHVLKHMMAQKSGIIINIGAEGARAGDGRAGYPRRSPYCCAKMGLIGLTETLSVEMGPFNIRVNCVSPAAVKGERIVSVITARAKAEGVPFEKMWKDLAANYSLGRITEEADVAAICLFLASDEAKSITGQTIVCHSGHHTIF
jgi:NAD(P)-dependent dehydrogenase (short-subunit alcohol dehydrogenase family)